MKNFFYSLRFRLVLFVLLAALPALAIILYSGIEQRQQAVVEAQQSTLRTVRSLVSQHELLIESTRTTLITWAHLMQFTDEGGLKCSDLFAHFRDTHYPYYSAFYIADLNANILCSMPQGDLPVDLATCEHYLELVQAEDFVFSEYHLCRNTGKGVISLGYPIRDDQDVKRAVINASIDMAWFNSLANDMDLPGDSTLTVLDRSGIILAHYPDPDTWVGKQMPEYSVGALVLEEVEGTAEGVWVDNIERLYAFIPLRGTEESVFVMIGIPAAQAFEKSQQTIVRNLLLLSAATLLALLAAWFLGDLFLVRQTQALVETTNRLASGDLSARTQAEYERGELGALARSIDSMAGSLAEREAERDRAEASIKEYAKELERSNKDLSDFANVASHDMQEPLRKVQIFGDLLKERYAANLDERGQEYVDSMRDAASRMRFLLNGLLAYSRLSTKSQTLTEVNLNHVVDSVLKDLELQIELTGAKVQVEKLPSVRVDAVQMHQLFLNMISNAIKFHQDGQAPQVRISANPSNGAEPFWEIQVADNGIGFEEKYNDRIFMPFQRLHGPGKYDGIGMGLAICRKIIERHGGKITGAGNPGKGAIFTVRLPAQAVGQSNTKEKDHERRSHHHPAG